MMHNLTPLYLSSSVPQTASYISRYNLHNYNALQALAATTKQDKKTTIRFKFFWAQNVSVTRPLLETSGSP